MKAVDLREFPTFYHTWCNTSNRTGDRYLRDCGYASAVYNPRSKFWEMSDEDYTMFVLRWGE